MCGCLCKGTETCVGGGGCMCVGLCVGGIQWAAQGVSGGGLHI